MDNITNDIITDETLTTEEETTEEVIEFEPFYNLHYIRIDEQNRIIHGFSDAFEQSKEGDICINEQGGYQFRLFEMGIENPPLSLWQYGEPIYIYKYINGEVMLRTNEEVNADIAALPEPAPTPTVEFATYDELAAAIREGVNEVE